jgi:MFS family permease
VLIRKSADAIRQRLWPASADANAKRLLGAKALRAIADGYVSILLPAYLIELGFDSLQVGLITTATLLGSAGAALLTGFMTARLGYRRAFLVATGLMVGTGISFAAARSFLPLLLIAFVGTLNPSSGDVSLFLPLEQSLLSHSVADRDRTALFARYSVIAALSGAVGALIAGTPELVVRALGASGVRASQGLFILYAILGLAAGSLYRRIVNPPEPRPDDGPTRLCSSRAVIYRLAALFSLDAFGGGFFVQAILALWLFRRFHLSVTSVASLFFWCNLLAAASYLVAPLIARRIGLIRTMVFTHLPSSLCLIAIPFAPSARAVIELLLLRSLLSQMDVPTRTSYVMAVVTPAERPAAAGITAVPRSLAAAASPVIAGYLLDMSSFAWPLLLGGTLKIVYDLLLLTIFRNLKPPEERQ